MIGSLALFAATFAVAAAVYVYPTAGTAALAALVIGWAWFKA